MRETILTFAAVVGVGCACGSERANPASPSPDPNPNSTPAATARYEVHEWGLATGSIGSGPFQLSTRPAPPPPVPMITRAPILYVHLLDGTSITFDLTVSVPNGDVTEHWPTAELSSEGVRWTSVRADPDSCHGTYPALGGPECSSVSDGNCEAAELAALEVSDAACLTVGGAGYNHLFYRGTPGSPAMPLRLQPAADGAVEVSNVGGTPVGNLLRVVRGPTATFAVVVPVPAPGASVTVPRPTNSNDIDRARRSIGEGLRALGMSSNEAQAFERAWMSELFEPTNTTRTRELTRGRRRLRPTTLDTLLYWLPEASADELARLNFEPPPIRVRRALLVRIQLGA